MKASHKRKILALSLVLAMTTTAIPMTAITAAASPEGTVASAPAAKELTCIIEFSTENLDIGEYVGNPFTIMGWGSGGEPLSTGYLYAFDYRLAGEEEWIGLSDFQKSDEFETTIEEPGEYEFRARAKDANGSIAEDTYTLPFYPRVINTSTVSAKAVRLGSSVTVTGQCEQLLEYDQVDCYDFEYRLKGETEWTAFGNQGETKATFTPKTVGTYEIHSVAQTYYCFDIEAIIEVEVNDAFTVNLTYDSKHPDQAEYIPAGDKLYLTAETKGSTGTCEYAFYTMQTNLTPEEAIRNNEAQWQLVQDYSSSPDVAVTMQEQSILWVKAVVKAKDGSTCETRRGYNYACPIEIEDVSYTADAISKSSTRSIPVSVKLSGGVRSYYNAQTDDVTTAQSESGIVSVGIIVNKVDGSPIAETYIEAESCNYYNGTLVVPLKASYFKNQQTGEITSGYYNIRLDFYDMAEVASTTIEGFLVSDRNMFMIGMNQISGEGSAIGEDVHTSVSIYQRDPYATYKYAFYTMYADCLPEEAIKAGTAEWELKQNFSNNGNFLTERKQNRILWIKAVVKDNDGLTAESYVGYNYSADPELALIPSVSSLTNLPENRVALLIAASGMSCRYNAGNNTFSRINTPSGFRDYQMTITGTDNNFTKTVSLTEDDLSYDENNNAIYQLKAADFDNLNGTYNITVSVSDLDTTMTQTLSNFKVTEFTITTPELSVTAPTVTSQGVRIKIKAEASGTEGPFTYTYQAAREIVQDNGEVTYKYITIAKNTTAAVVRYSPLVAGKYQLIVQATDASGATAEFTQPLEVAPRLVNTSSVAADIIVTGNEVTVNAASTGGVGTCQYAVYYKKTTSGSYLKARGYSTDPTVTFKPSSTATYDILVKARDEMGTVVEKALTVKINPTLRNRSTISAEEIIQGESVTVQGVGFGGTEGYQYTVLYKKSTSEKYAVLRGYSDNPEIVFTPASPVSYDLKVKVRDSSGKTVAKNFTVKVSPAPLVNTSTLSSDTIKVGDIITVNASCTGGTGTKLYAVSYRKAKSETWHTAQSFKKNNVIELPLASVTSYEVLVKVKDSSGTVSEKLLTISPGA